MHARFASMRFAAFVLAVVGSFVSTGAIHAETGRPNCYVLSVGVDRYRADDVPNLHGCVNDAQDISTQFQNQAGRLFNRVEVTTLTDAAASHANIHREMRRLRTLGRSGDSVVLYASGHGDRPATGWQFLPADFEPARSEATCIRGRDMLHLADDLAKQGKKVFLVLDACFTGQLRVEAREVLERSHPSGGGVVLMLSSASTQTSAALGQNSAFTLALKEALAGRADLNHDGVITLEEIRHYTFHRTHELVRQRAMPSQDGVCISSCSIPSSLILSQTARPQLVGASE